MRSEKELLQVLVDNIGKMEYGLCGLAAGLALYYIISKQEKDAIKNYIKTQAPIRLHSNGTKLSFNWPVGEIKPRLEWLQEQIKKLES